MVNAVMLCYDRPRLLEQALRSLYEHTPREDFNLTLVDDDSKDFKVHKLILTYGYKSNSTVVSVHNSRHVLSQAKNIGVSWSEQHFGRGDWLYLSDSDVYFTPEWLRWMIYFAAGTEDLGYRLWGGQVHPYHQPIDRGSRYVPSLGAVIPYHVTDGVSERSVLDGPSWLMRWQTWDNHGPLKRDAAAGPCQSEEYPFCESVCTEGRIGVIQPHLVYHTGLTNSKGEDAPGCKEREALKVPGVLYE